MPQQKSTMFSAAKVANFGVVMAEMVGKMSEMEKEIKRLRHHVSVLSKRNHQLMKEGKSRAASPIASDVSLSDEEDVGDERLGLMRFTATGTEEEFGEVLEDLRTGSRTLRKKLVESMEKAKERGVVAETVAEEEEVVAEPKVWLPSYEDKKGKRRRLGNVEEEVEEVSREEEVLIAPLGPRAECGGLLRRVGRESVFVGADPRIVAGGGFSNATPVGLSRGLDTRRQSLGARGGYQLRPRVGFYGGNGCGGRGRGRGV